MSLTLSPEWHISKNGYDLLKENPNINYENLLKLALDTDVKEICSPVLSNELSKERTSKIVLQIQKIRNISAPKTNEESQAAPRMLKLCLTDGETCVQALELLPLNFISRDKTPPGTKILIRNAKVSFGYLILTPNNCTLLGGRVPALIEKWELAKSIKNTQKIKANEDGSPPWVNFGSKIQKNNESNNFKSFGGKYSEINKANSEFELHRQGAIAEATSGAIKKVFGGRVSQNIQADQRFEKKKFTQNRTKVSNTEKEIEKKTEKPQEKVSLFSFLENKLPVNEHRTSHKDTPSKEDNFLNKSIGSSFHNEKKGQNKEPIRSPYLNDKSDLSTISRACFLKGSDKNTSKQYKNQKSASYQRSSNSNENANKLTNLPEKTEESHYQQKKYFLGKNQNGDHNVSSRITLQSPINKNKKNIEEPTQLMTKMPLNSQFASRSLRQHFKFDLTRQNQSNNTLDFHQNTWNIGDACLAKYWEDGKFYDAEIVAFTDKTIVVKFSGYGNIEEVVSADCVPNSLRNNRQLPLDRRNDRKPDS